MRGGFSWQLHFSVYLLLRIRVVCPLPKNSTPPRAVLPLLSFHPHLLPPSSDLWAVLTYWVQNRWAKSDTSSPRYGNSNCYAILLIRLIFVTSELAFFFGLRFHHLTRFSTISSSSPGPVLCRPDDGADHMPGRRRPPARRVPRP